MAARDHPHAPDSPMSMEDNIHEMYRSMNEVARHGGYRECAELAPVLVELAWFDNFGIECYSHRLEVAERLSRRLSDDDMPEQLQEELDAL